MTELMYFLKQEYGGEVTLISQGPSVIDFGSGAQTSNKSEQTMIAVLLPERTSLFRPIIPQALSNAAPLGVGDVTRIILIDKDDLTAPITLFGLVMIGGVRYSISQPLDLPYENAFQLILVLDKGASQ